MTAQGTGSRYRYRAARHDGVIESGIIAAEGATAASDLLAGRGLFPMTVESTPSGIGGRASVPIRELAVGLRVLATLLESGLPISRVMGSLNDVMPASWHGAVESMQASIREGKGFSAALASSSLHVPAIVTGIIQAGEAGSGLAAAVRRAAELMETRAANRAALRSALAYPLLLAATGLGSVVLLVGVVLPRFSQILTDLGQPLPPTTRMVLGAGDFVRAAGWPAILVGLACAGVWRVWIASERGTMQWHGFLLATPVVGELRWADASARVNAALAALLDSGVPLSAALLHAAPSSGDAVLAARVLAARTAVAEGQRIAAALASARAVTPVALRLIRAGEDAGSLTTMLAHASRLDAERADQLVKRLLRFVEPVMILAFGGIVSLVAAALLQAIYSVRPLP